ncbi:hypothetical protein Tco_1396786, partial [Tanacetum coccineum]
EEVVPKVDDVSLVNGVFHGAFGGDGEEDFVMGKGLEEEACVDAINYLNWSLLLLSPQQVLDALPD